VGKAMSGRRRFGRAAARTDLVVAVTDERGRPLAIRGLAAWLSRVAPPRARGAVTIAIVDDARIRELNRRYRRKDYATDVLSFPAFDSASNARARTASRRGRTDPQVTNHSNSQSPIPNPRPLGDVVIARGVARRQAREAGHSELTELKVLALHGLLHLLGYDHERDGGRMRRVERRLRRRGGLREGLIERSA